MKSNTIISMFVPKMWPEYQRFEKCHQTSNETFEDRAFRIGLECFKAKKLCQIGLPEEIGMRSPKKIDAWRFHPQHLTICQNMTFWKDKRRQSRNHIFVFHSPNYCFPTLTSWDNNFRLKIMKFKLELTSSEISCDKGSNANYSRGYFYQTLLSIDPQKVLSIVVRRVCK
jgi:hypothetical protein